MSRLVLPSKDDRLCNEIEILKSQDKMAQELLNGSSEEIKDAEKVELSKIESSIKKSNKFFTKAMRSDKRPL